MKYFSWEGDFITNCFPRDLHAVNTCTVQYQRVKSVHPTHSTMEADSAACDNTPSLHWQHCVLYTCINRKIYRNSVFINTNVLTKKLGIKTMLYRLIDTSHLFKRGELQSRYRSTLNERSSRAEMNKPNITEIGQLLAEILQFEKLNFQNKVPENMLIRSLRMTSHMLLKSRF